jgi:elongation factor G
VRWEVAPEQVPPVYRGTVTQAVRDASESGVQWGYPITDVAVDVVGGAHHEIHSSDLAFRSATLNAFRDGCRKAEPVLLEPIMSLELLCPKDFVGSVVNSLAARGGRLLGTEAKGAIHVLRAEAPLSRMFGFATDVRSASQGRATYSMLFARFDEVEHPGAILP